jgi:hypothetical protein
LNNYGWKHKITLPITPRESPEKSVALIA